MLSVCGAQFMMGDRLMVRPVFGDGVRSVNAYLPSGRWRHVWSGENATVVAGPRWVEVRAPVGQPAVWLREGGDDLSLLEPFLELVAGSLLEDEG